MRVPPGWIPLLIAACQPAGDTASARPPSALVIVVDGVRTDEFCSLDVSDLTGVSGEANAPRTWESIATSGSTSRAVTNTGVTVTAPAHAALLTGRPEPYANFPIDDAQGPGLYRPAVPTLFEELRSQLDLGEEDALFLTNTELLEGLAASLAPGAGAGARWELVPGDDGYPGDDTAVLRVLRRAIDEGPPRLIVVNLHDVDRAGHYKPVDDYTGDVAIADAGVADLWEWISAGHPEYAENLLFVLTSDHGRHRDGDDEPWRNHGDGCDGCRELPLFVVGGGAEPGGTLPAATTQLDLAPTIAAHLGVALPWAEGIPIPALTQAGTTRSGIAWRAESGGHVVTQEWLDTSTERSRILLDGEVVSTLGASDAEAPSVVAAGETTLACWRELTRRTGDLAWSPTCVADGRDTEFPAVDLGPYGGVALTAADTKVWAAWADNAHGTADLREGTVGLSVASWSADAGWSAPLLSPAYFPTDAAIAAAADTVVAAFGTSLGDPDYRYTRRVRVVPVSDAGMLGSTDFARDGARVELPALAAEGDRVSLGVLVLDEDGAHLEAAASEDGGRTWGPLTRLPEGGAPFVHLAPAWDGGALVWAARVGEEAALCRAAPGDDTAACIPLGSARVRGFTVRDGEATVLRDAAVGAWEMAEGSW